MAAFAVPQKMLVNLVLLVAILATRGLVQAQLPPIPSLSSGQPIDLQKCSASLVSAQECLKEVTGSLGSRIKILGPACCKAITEINENCWPNMFPTNPFFPPLIKSFCDVWSPPPSSSSKVKLPSLPNLLPGKDFADCFSSLTNIVGCASEIRNLLNNGQNGALSPTCCNAISAISDKCWPKVLPSKPFPFELLEQTCAKSADASPAPK